MMTVAVLGAGNVGSAVARLAKDAGLQVRMADCLPIDEVQERISETVPGAIVCEGVDATRDADLVILSVPLHAYSQVPRELLDGQIVVDLMNYWEGVDGGKVTFEDDESDPQSDSQSDSHRISQSVSESVAAHFPKSRWVKTLNHISLRDMEDDASPAGTPGRRALAVASDDEGAASKVTDFLDKIGFDAVYSGPLQTGVALQPGTDIFNGKFTKEELTSLLR